MGHPTRHLFRLLLLLSLLACLACAASPPAETPAQAPPSPASRDMADRCAQMVGPPRVERISQNVWLAIGYDIANTVVITTPQGLVVVDPGMTPARARQTMAALKERVPWAPVKAIIFTHSHADHIGGATVWAEPGTAIWATAEAPAHLLKQYASFRDAEFRRGQRQLGLHVPLELLPCSALGRRADLDQAGEVGLLMPDHTFSGRKTLDFGGLAIELVEAPGETHDHLLVWLPGERTLVAGDDFYWTFPNLYTIRGTSPRPVEGWIKSLDAMRALAPEHLVPCHTKPIQGAEEIQRALTNYRDAIQWVLVQVVRRANQGQDLDTMAEEIQLPPHLAGLPYLQQTYGQVDWSAKAIFTNHLGWFDGRPEELYPPEHRQAAAREVELMGGAAKLMELARQSLAQDDPRWAVHLLAKLKRAGLARGALAEPWSQLQAQALTAVAMTVPNTNGRAYLLESVHELTHGVELPPKRHLPPRMIQQIPVEFLLGQMATNLDPQANLEVHQSLVLAMSDSGQRFVVTQRRGLVEVIAGAPLPGTPEPLATLTMTSDDFRQMALGMAGPLVLRAEGRIQVEGGWLKALAFLARMRPTPRGGR